jgi:hypothetical protein
LTLLIARKAPRQPLQGHGPMAAAGIMLRRGIAASLLFMVMLFAAFAPSAGASHAGAIADCGSAGTFTVKATTNSAGFQIANPVHRDPLRRKPKKRLAVSQGTSRLEDLLTRRATQVIVSRDLAADAYGKLTARRASPG